MIRPLRPVGRLRASNHIQHQYRAQAPIRGYAVEGLWARRTLNGSNPCGMPQARGGSALAHCLDAKSSSNHVLREDRLSPMWIGNVHARRACLNGSCHGDGGPTGSHMNFKLRHDLNLSPVLAEQGQRGNVGRIVGPISPLPLTCAQAGVSSAFAKGLPAGRAGRRREREHPRASCRRASGRHG
jgi:hypothetical protein